MKLTRKQFFKAIAGAAAAGVAAAVGGKAVAPQPPGQVVPMPLVDWDASGQRCQDVLWGYDSWQEYREARQDALWNYSQRTNLDALLQSVDANDPISHEGYLLGSYWPSRRGSIGSVPQPPGQVVPMPLVDWDASGQRCQDVLWGYDSWQEYREARQDALWNYSQRTNLDALLQSVDANDPISHEGYLLGSYWPSRRGSIGSVPQQFGLWQQSALRDYSRRADATNKEASDTELGCFVDEYNSWQEYREAQDVRYSKRLFEEADRICDQMEREADYA